jgi:hypothetical protein
MLVALCERGNSKVSHVTWLGTWLGTFLTVISTMSNTIEFSPAIPWPVPFDVRNRIQELRGYLDPKNPQYERKQQHVNIRAAIQLYEDGEIDGSQDVCIMEGKVVTEQEMFKGTTWAWVEVHSLSPSLRTHLTNWFKLQGTCHQFAHKFAYGHV